MNDLQAAWLALEPPVHRQLDDAVSGRGRGSWAVGILLAGLHASGRGDCAEAELARIVDIGLDPDRWAEAHDAFGALRQVTLRFERRGGETTCRLLVDLAESAAKVIYNASGNDAPFDASSGALLVARAAVLAAHLDRPEATDMLWRAVAGRPDPPR